MNVSHIHCSQSQCVNIANLEFIGCGGNQVKHVKKFLAIDTKFEGEDNSGTALELVESKVQIVNTTFISNIGGSFRQCQKYFPETVCSKPYHQLVSIGGAIIATNSTIDITQSKFVDNRADYGGAIY